MTFTPSCADCSDGAFSGIFAAGDVHRGRAATIGLGDTDSLRYLNMPLPTRLGFNLIEQRSSGT